MSALYLIGKTMVAPVLRALWRPRVTGLEHVPEHGPVILAANHLSVIDSILMPIVVPQRLYFLAKSEYFKSPVSRFFVAGLNQIPVDRSSGRASLMALDAALPVLRAGNFLGIFPEGTRSPDGRLYRGRPGVARLALDAGAEIVPIGLVGTERIHPIGATLPKLVRGVELRIGPPLDLSPWRDVDPADIDSRALRQICELLMLEIQKLTGQEYVGRYAPKRVDAPA